MNNEELKKALASKYKVEHKGIVYDYVSAIILRNEKKKIVIYAELTDKNKNSVFIVSPKHLKKVKANKEK